MLEQYNFKMYDSLDSSVGLRTGDIIKLNYEDFRKIARHDSLLRLFQDFENNPEYSQKFWVILNKECDMVHSSPQRYFIDNLFIAPLQGLKTIIKKGTLGRDILESNKGKPINEKLNEAYKKYFNQKTKKDNPRKDKEGGKDYNKRIQEITKPATGKFRKLISENIQDVSRPQNILESIKDFVEENQAIHEDILNFEKSKEWKQIIDDYKKEQQEVKGKSSKIILSKYGRNKLLSLALNQLDSSGIFFYEPNRKISSREFDLCYVVQIEDMLSLKVKKEIQCSGGLVELLKRNRVAILDRNFSDRLLNVMGNYFSKIGTPDVDIVKILELYRTTFPDSFFTSDEEYKEAND